MTPRAARDARGTTTSILPEPAADGRRRPPRDNAARARRGMTVR